MKRLAIMLWLLCLWLCGCSATTAAPPQTESSAPTEALDRTLILENESCGFWVEGISSQEDAGSTVTVTCENRTSQPLMFTWADTTVNDYVIDPHWAVQVDGSTQISSEILFPRRILEQCGITSLDEILFHLQVYDASDHKADYVAEINSALYPTGLDAHTVPKTERPIKPDERILAENERCMFVIQNAYHDPEWGYVVECYMENRSNTALFFTWEDTRLNGIQVDPLWAIEVPPGKRACSSVIVLPSELTQLQQVQEVTFTLYVYNSDHWSAPAVIREVFSYKQ